MRSATRWTRAAASTSRMAFLLRRLAYMVYVLAGMSLIMFVVSRALPGNPALIYAGEQNVTTERLERARSA